MTVQARSAKLLHFSGLLMVGTLMLSQYVSTYHWYVICIMRVGHVFVGLVFLWALLVSEHPLSNVSLASRHLTSWCGQGSCFPPSNITLGGRNRGFLDGVSVPLEFLGSLYCVHFDNSYGVGSNEPLCLWNLDAGIKVFSHILSYGYSKPRFALLSSTKVKFRRHKCLCGYYSNLMATFHLPPVGDLVFKLNPGPVVNSTPRIASTVQNNNIHRKNRCYLHATH